MSVLQAPLRARRVGVLAILSLCSACDRGTAPTDGTVRARGEAFGTGWSVIATEAASSLTPIDGETLAEVVQQELDAIDASVSTWRDDSEITTFNRLGADFGRPIGPSFRSILLTSREVFDATGGAFDPTVGPLVDGWGFGARGSRDAEVPSDKAIATLLESVGFDRLRLDLVSVPGEEPHLLQPDPPLELDLSAVAKGYAVDLVAHALMEQGLDNYFVEVGGEVRARGISPRGEAWRVGVTAPTNEPGAAATVAFAVSVSDGAVATSGDYRNFRLVDGVKYSHTIDPRTGRPVEDPPASVTVVGPTCVLADAWATALCVLGPHEGLELIEQRPELEALFLMRPAVDGADFERFASSGFERLLVEKP
ncbi:MAG: FAD:protein FMN transferase [Planctomycetota bacterium]